MAPPRLPTEFDVNDDVVMVAPRVSTMMAPPLALVAWLLAKLDPEMFTVPLPVPPGVANASWTMSIAPPPQQIEAAVLRVNAESVTVMTPVPPVCMGDEGVYITPPPLVKEWFASDASLRSDTSVGS